MKELRCPHPQLLRDHLPLDEPPSLLPRHVIFTIENGWCKCNERDFWIHRRRKKTTYLPLITYPLNKIALISLYWSFLRKNLLWKDNNKGKRKVEVIFVESVCFIELKTRVYIRKNSTNIDWKYATKNFIISKNQ